jgi:hypothetical protein
LYFDSGCKNALYQKIPFVGLIKYFITV